MVVSTKFFLILMFIHLHSPASCVCVCVYVCVCTRACAHMYMLKSKDSLQESGSCSVGSKVELNSCSQAWRQMPLLLNHLTGPILFAYPYLVLVAFLHCLVIYSLRFQCSSCKLPKTFLYQIYRHLSYLYKDHANHALFQF